jgi:hypothetical protein
MSGWLYRQIKTHMDACQWNSKLAVVNLSDVHASAMGTDVYGVHA